MRRINKVAVLGSGVMGSRIACHFANANVPVVLLDIAPKDSTTADSSSVRNKIVNDALQQTLKSNPSAVFNKAKAKLIQIGNFDDDLSKISECDWIIEVVVENLDIKKQLFDKVEKFRKAGTIISSNTSGIPINLMLDGRSDDFKKNFCGTHFFNPPRYLPLLEIIPTKETDRSVVDFLMHYGDLYLGKTTVLCKDTPAFIANRIGVYSIMTLFHLVKEMNLSIDEVDRYTGAIVGRPKSATFRTTDVVGLDTLIKVAKGLQDNLPNDESKSSFQIPDFILKMESNNWLGDKTKQGFYKKTKNEKGEKEILSLNLYTLEYQTKTKFKSSTLEALKTVDDLKERLRILSKAKDTAGVFFRKTMYNLFAYCSNRIPEISDELYRIDDAMRAGFGWELGPFQTWDVLGVKETVEAMKSEGLKVAPWIEEMIADGKTSFYQLKNSKPTFYNQQNKTYESITGSDAFIILDHIRENKTVWKNSGVTVTDLGDGILNCEFHTKMNSIGGEVLQGINKAIDIAEKDFCGLVVGNQGANFSAGANIAMIFMMAVEQEYDEIDFAIRHFQKTMMRVRYSSIPVVAAPHHLALGGGCELCLHADWVQANAETYMGLVEFGVGVIPGGGGSKEFALRISDAYRDGDYELNTLREKFLTIGMAKVSTSALEAFDLGYLKQGQFGITMNYNRLIEDAKQKAIELADAGYVRPKERTDIKVLGRQGLGMVYIGANTMYSGHFISEHDKKISEKLGYVLCGGDLSEPTLVSEQYLLDLEREAFLSLCAERKTLERLQAILKGGKPLRN
ncbi:MAG: 3-hydroxyacyl-CoA dehydrogenase/enoyl-CoA hydratase family protein [bacterium]